MAGMPYVYGVGMIKTTVYLPEHLKRQLERAASVRNVSEAELIRSSIELSVGAEPPVPRGGFIAEATPEIDWNSSNHLAGFGEK
jgi:hypothetical protein